MKRRTFIKLSGVAGGTVMVRPALSAVPLRTDIPDTADRVLEQLVDAAMQRGAVFAEARLISLRSQSIHVRKTDVSPAGDTRSAGISLRVRDTAGWGFAASSSIADVNPDQLARRALSIAGAFGALQADEWEADRRVRTHEHWVTPGATDPFQVPFNEKKEFLLGLTRPPLEHPDIAFAVANLFQVKREELYRNSAGGQVEQSILHCYPNFAVTSFDRTTQSIISRSSFLEAGAYGWEITSGYGFESELATAMLEALKAQRADAVTDGEAKLVIDPSALWHIIYETIAHHLDPRSALLLAGRRPGDTWITADRVGSTRLGSDALTVSFDSELHGGLATAGWDGSGMPAASGMLINGGILEQLPGSEDSRLPATPASFLHAKSSAWNVPPAFAMPNLVVQGGSGRTLEGLARETGDGYLIKGRGRILINASHTLFRYRPQLAWRIRNGHIEDMVRDLEIETTVEQFWSAVKEFGGDRQRMTAGDLFPQSRNALWDTPFSVSTPPARFAEIPVYRTQRG